MFKITWHFWITILIVLLLQIGYYVAIYYGWMKQKRVELLIIDLEFAGTAIGILSVASATGVLIGGYAPQIVRWEYAGLISTYLLWGAWYMKRSVIHNDFKDTLKGSQNGNIDSEIDLNEKFKQLIDRPGFPSKWPERYLKEFLDVTCELSKTAGGPFLKRVEVYIQIATNESAARTSKRYERASFLLSLVAIIISIGVSLWINYSSDARSKQWEENQLKILQEIKAGLEQGVQ